MTTDENLAAVPAEVLPALRDDAALKDWAELLVARARSEGVELTGDGGLLTGLMRQVLQTGLEVEMVEHLGYERHGSEGRGSGNSRNGSSAKTVTTEVGDVELRVPRDRAGTFDQRRGEPQRPVPVGGSSQGPLPQRAGRNKSNVYLTATSKKKNRENLTGRMTGWKTILNALTVHYGERIADHIR